jgi:hypothetical protein
MFVLLFAVSPFLYFHLIGAFVDRPLPTPFNDLGAILTAGQCWRHGVNVYAPSACMGGGVFNYSPFMLRLSYLPLGPDQRVIGGLLLDMAFLASLALLPPDGPDMSPVFRLLAVCSPNVVFALERANFDIVMFLFVLVAVLLLRAHRTAIAGYGLFLAAAALKFYPIVLMVLALRERPLRFLTVLAISLCCFAAYLFLFARSTGQALNILPPGLPFDDAFGAASLPFGVMLLAFQPIPRVLPDIPGDLVAIHHPFAGALFSFARFGLSLAALIWVILRARQRRFDVGHIDDERRLFLLAGCLLIAFCFFCSMNAGYRSIFLLLTLPALCLRAPTDAGKWLVRPLALAILLLLWETPLRLSVYAIGLAVLGPVHDVYPQAGFWLLRELLWWWVATEFVGFIAGFAWGCLADWLALSSAWRSVRRAAPVLPR